MKTLGDSLNLSTTTLKADARCAKKQKIKKTAPTYVSSQLNSYANTQCLPKKLPINTHHRTVKKNIKNTQKISLSLSYDQFRKNKK
jgi:hypothetical protein